MTVKAHESLAPAMLLDRSDLARELRCSVKTINRMLGAGQIGPRVVRIGVGQKSGRFNRREVEAWLATPLPDGTLMDRAQWQAFNR